MGKRIGHLDGRRPVVGGIRGWTGVPALLIPGQEQAFGIYEDCLRLTETATPAGVGHVPPGWTADVIGAANGTIIMGDVIGGVWIIQTIDEDDDWIQITLGDAANGAFCPSTYKDIWYETRIKVSNLDEINVAFGLVDPQAGVYLGNAGVGMTTADHIVWLIVDGTAGITETWHIEAADSDGGTTTNVDTEVDAAMLTWHTFGFIVHNTTDIFWYYDRAQVYHMADVLTIPNNKMLMPFFAVKAGRTVVAKVMPDWVMCVQQRWPTDSEPTLV